MIRTLKMVYHAQIGHKCRNMGRNADARGMNDVEMFEWSKKKDFTQPYGTIAL